jgi:tRNA (cytidine/uridine-2'-O-)-methyltransferase
MTLHIALHKPEIPPNTGNIIRLSANCGAQLHLIYPMGFTIDDKRAQRAGLDYHELANVKHHKSYQDFLIDIKDRRLIACETNGVQHHSDFQFQDEDVILFGSETKGLPNDILHTIGSDNTVRIPMKKNIRSLNLSNSVAIVIYEAWRQLNYA